MHVFLKHIDPNQGRIQNFFAGGGGGGGRRGGALIIIVWARLRSIARKRGRCTRGLGLRPSRFFTVMLLRRVFVVFISSARHKTPPLVAMNISFLDLTLRYVSGQD